MVAVGAVCEREERRKVRTSTGPERSGGCERAPQRCAVRGARPGSRHLLRHWGISKTRAWLKMRAEGLRKARAAPARASALLAGALLAGGRVGVFGAAVGPAFYPQARARPVPSTTSTSRAKCLYIHLSVAPASAAARPAQRPSIAMSNKKDAAGRLVRAGAGPAIARARLGAMQGTGRKVTRCPNVTGKPPPRGCERGVLCISGPADGPRRGKNKKVRDAPALRRYAPLTLVFRRGLRALARTRSSARARPPTRRPRTQTCHLAGAWRPEARTGPPPWQDKTDALTPTRRSQAASLSPPLSSRREGQTQPARTPPISPGPGRL